MAKKEGGSNVNPTAGLSLYLLAVLINKVNDLHDQNLIAEFEEHAKNYENQLALPANDHVPESVRTDTRNQVAAFRSLLRAAGR